ncbi:unnamed protein product [Mycena citricolor]|uniref:MFS general substrate transporter n=1 Tax=Mycena citricolor TaxID=2018698 RepID=A0AAD2I0Q3_9AGAR|nr:unnamed protein product [Mycena citricolor]
MSLENEKDSGEVVMIETTERDIVGAESPLPAIGTPERAAAERAIVRKLDRRLLPTILVIYLMNYIDRQNVTTARLKGLEQDLGLSGNAPAVHATPPLTLVPDIQYNVVLSIVYVSYCPFQIPSNMILNYITRPSWYIGSCVVLWGLTSLLTGLTHNYAGIVACRVSLGIPEVGISPLSRKLLGSPRRSLLSILAVSPGELQGRAQPDHPPAVYLLSRWYTKKELAFRVALLYGANLTSNAFGSLIAAGILSKMEGVRGIRAWRWLFFIEGAISIAVGLIAIWSLPDYPNNTRWISSDQRRLAQARLADDAGEADQDNAGDTPLAGLKMAICDPIVLTFAIMNLAQLFGFSFNNFCEFILPPDCSLTATFGFSTTISLLLAAPPWIFAACVCCLNAWHADRTGERYFHLSGWWWPVMVGFIISLSTMSVAGRYFSMFLMTIGYAGFAMTAVWVSNTIARPPAKRAAAIGIVNGVGNVGNIMGSYTWKSKWGPRYHQSMIISLCSLLFASALAFGIRRNLIAKNRRLAAIEKSDLQGGDEVRVREAAVLEGITFEQAMERRKGFRYLY